MLIWIIVIFIWLILAPVVPMSVRSRSMICLAGCVLLSRHLFCHLFFIFHGARAHNIAAGLFRHQIRFTFITMLIVLIRDVIPFCLFFWVSAIFLFFLFIALIFLFLLVAAIHLVLVSFVVFSSSSLPSAIPALWLRLSFFVP